MSVRELAGMFPPMWMIHVDDEEEDEEGALVEVRKETACITCARVVLEAQNG